MSNIDKSHKNYVADLKFVPGSVKVDRKMPNEGKSYHFVSCAEDGTINIWDTRSIEINELKSLASRGKPVTWTPFLTIQLHRAEGGELGLSRILFEPNQTTPTFWAASDEGELAFVDWSIRPIQQGEEQRPAEYVQRIYESERNSRPVLALERSPFYDDLLLTIHDFHFAIWKISLLEREEPIFRSANTRGSQNTCGAFSPTRPGVIFITKNNGIDIWDFYDQSNKPSIQMNLASQTITYFKFQQKYEGQATRTQLMAYGDEADGTLNLQEVAVNLRQPQENEEEEIRNFWENEVVKCNYVKERRVTMREQWSEKVKQEEIKKAIEEAKREEGPDVEREKEDKEELAYEALLLTMKTKLNLITQEQLEAM